jgi:hypothetical protein
LRRINLANVLEAGESFEALWEKAGKELSPASIIIENCECDDFRRILGVNVWEGATWFNKESFGEALFFSAVFALGYGKLSGIVAGVEKFAAAELASGYRLDALIDELSGGKKKKAPASAAAKPDGGKKTPTVTKPAAVKPAAAKPAAASTKPATAKPAASKPATAKKSVAAKPAAKKPAKK